MVISDPPNAIMKHHGFHVSHVHLKKLSRVDCFISLHILSLNLVILFLGIIYLFFSHTFFLMFYMQRKKESNETLAWNPIILVALNIITFIFLEI